jgi:hypothetical protein
MRIGSWIIDISILASQVTLSILITTYFSSILDTPLGYLYILFNIIITYYISIIYYLLYKVE